MSDRPIDERTELGRAVSDRRRDNDDEAFKARIAASMKRHAGLLDRLART